MGRLTDGDARCSGDFLVREKLHTPICKADSKMIECTGDSSIQTEDPLALDRVSIVIIDQELVQSDMDPGLAQDQDSSETVTNGCDINGNGRNTSANVLWMVTL